MNVSLSISFFSVTIINYIVYYFYTQSAVLYFFLYVVQGDGEVNQVKVSLQQGSISTMTVNDVSQNNQMAFMQEDNVTPRTVHSEISRIDRVSDKNIF